MKLQFLGDSKDCFKWDYHDFLTSQMRYDLLNIVFMLTPDEEISHGRTEASLFDADDHIVDFCKTLRATRDPSRVSELPVINSSAYQVSLHRADTYLDNTNRYDYFSEISGQKKQIIFLDPDNGFEPERSISEKHLGYQDVFHILDQVPDCALLSVFHHFRRIKFDQDYRRIRQRLNGLPTTAIQWNNSLMFVNISKSQEVIENAKQANALYSKITEKTAIL